MKSLRSDIHSTAPALPFVRSPFNYDRDAASDESGLKCEDPSLAEQNFREETDINYIVDRFIRTGVAPQVDTTPSYGDFTNSSDYHTALNNIIAAQDAFMALPAGVRSKFDNDPAGLLDFLSDDKNYDEAVKLGLVAAKADGKETPFVDPQVSKKGGSPAPVSKGAKKTSHGFSKPQLLEMLDTVSDDSAE